jgi:hypothetical protein
MDVTAAIKYRKSKQIYAVYEARKISTKCQSFCTKQNCVTIGAAFGIENIFVRRPYDLVK